MDLWSSVLNTLSKTDMNKWGNLLSGGAAAYGAYKQGQAANKIAKLQLRDYEDEKARKKRTQGRIDTAYAARLPLTVR